MLITCFYISCTCQLLAQAKVSPWQLLEYKRHGEHMVSALRQHSDHHRTSQEVYVIQMVYSKTGSSPSNRDAFTNAFTISRDAWIRHSWCRMNMFPVSTIVNATPFRTLRRMQTRRLGSLVALLCALLPQFPCDHWLLQQLWMMVAVQHNRTSVWVYIHKWHN